MKKIEQHYLDKTQWRNGPWQSEPDRISWVDPETGYDCLIRRHDTLGFYCGYVAVTKDHTWYEKKYSDVDIECHGGLTYSRECDGDVEKGICHITKEDDKSWWFGFDCAHAGDIIPGPDYLDLSPLFEMDLSPLFEMDVYQDLSYLTSEVESIAKQLKDKDKEQK